jgi:hypothetical protein
MKHNIIKTQNYLLVVDDSEIKEGDWIYNKEREPSILQCMGKGSLRGWSKIIAHLPLNNSPILEGVPLLTPLEDEVENLVDGVFGKRTTDNFATREVWKHGYNKAKEKYKYTEQDLKKAIEMAQECFICECFLGPHIEREHTEESIIQSLQQPKYPIAFECEMEFIDNQDFMDFGEDATTWPGLIESTEQPKTTTNSQGQTVWVGTYKYE